MPKITKRVVDTLRPSADGEVFTWDTELRGFGVRMMPSGVGSFILKYRNAEGRQRKLALARVGTMTPEEARGVARQRLAEVARGEDPSAARQATRKAITVAELCDLYLEDAKDRLKASTWSQNRSQIESHVKPLIGRHSVPSLTTADVERMHADIAAGKTAAARKGRAGRTTGGKAVAARTVVIFGGILEFARKRRIVMENVARDVDTPASKKQTRYLNRAEIKRFGEALRAAEAAGENATGIAAIRFLLLSGCRKMEVLALPVAWVDREAGCIRFGDTKTGAQLRPIGAAAFAVLPDGEGPWVFPAARGDGHFVGARKILDAVCQRAELQGVTIHVLRHSFAATAAGLGFSELTIAGLLGHSVQGVTARYAHVPDSALVAAADRVAGEIFTSLR